MWRPTSEESHGLFPIFRHLDPKAGVVHQLAKQRLVIQLILDYQDAKIWLAWSQAHHIIRQFLLQLGRAIPLYWLHWQLNPEYRAFTKSAGDVDGTSQQSEVMLSDRESQPGPLL